MSHVQIVQTQAKTGSRKYKSDLFSEEEEKEEM